jgi:hypothetical protein
MTGWNLPPGCTVADIERAAGTEQPCDVCGQMADGCICPECPVCHTHGDPQCYEPYYRKRRQITDFTGRKYTQTVRCKGHGMKRNRAQLIGAQERKAEELAGELLDVREYLFHLRALPDEQS